MSILDIDAVQSAIDQLHQSRVILSETEMLGPTGESNRLYEYARGPVLCLGPNLEFAQEQANIAKNNGCAYLIVCPGAEGEHCINGFLPREFLTGLNGFSVVVLWSESPDVELARRALALRDGKIISLICDDNLARACKVERHVCVDTTAAGGNTTLLASSA